MRLSPLKMLPLNFWRAANKARTLQWWLRSQTPPASEPHRTDITADTPPAPFDLRRHNPIHWPRNPRAKPASLPPSRPNPTRLRKHHHVLDAPDLHTNPAARATLLARLAAHGVVLYAPDAYANEPLRQSLGNELCRLIQTDPRQMNPAQRELHSIATRRTAMRQHSSWTRNPDALPLITILIATRRPTLLPHALASAAIQTYPKLELALALHGNPADFDNFKQHTRQLPFPVKTVQVPPQATLGAALNAATAISSGPLIAKMDDDDCYSPDHIWDLALARQYSGAALVAKGIEFVYLAQQNQTLHCRTGQGEAYRASSLAGGTLLTARHNLTHAGGWRNAPQAVDQALTHAILRTGKGIYRTHGAGYILIRHGHNHTWPETDARFLAKADHITPGWTPAIAGIPNATPPPALSAAPP